MDAAKNNFSEVKGNVLYWTVSDIRIATEDAKQLADEIRAHIASGRVSKMIVDNSELNGVWKAEINDVWEQLMKDILMSGRLSRIATISPTAISKMQIDRLSRQAGTYEFNRAFLDKEEALAFLEK